MKFVYKDNRQSPPLILAEIIAKDILEADELFENQTKLKPAKLTWIGCSILPM